MDSKKERFFILNVLVQLVIFSIGYLGLSEFLIRKYIIKNDDEINGAKIFNESNSVNTIWGDSQSLYAFQNLKNYKNLSRGGANYQEIELKIKNYYSRVQGNERSVILILGANHFGTLYNTKVPPEVFDFYLSNKIKKKLYISSKYFQKSTSRYIKNFLLNDFKIVEKDESVTLRDGSKSSNYVYNPDIDSYGNEILNDPFSIFYPNQDYVKNPNFDALIRTIDYLKNEKINICLVSTPWYSNMRKEMDKNYSIYEIRQFFKDLSKKEDLKYFDYYDLDLPLKYFKDPIHLNREGAILFTELVEKKCEL